ncbi:MAG: hypothetical protein DMF72_20445 [Acidobacteria bacterium]|nr:MAG: hypothetical protein DMF72_20445 [Acidobacteriota bacterium]
MSYLSTLAARALDQPQPIRPRLPSLFEAAAGPRVNFRELTVNKHSQPEQRTSSRSEERSNASQKSNAVASTIQPARQIGVPEPVAAHLTDRPLSIKSVSGSAQTSATQPERAAEPAIDRSIKLREIELADKAESDRASLLGTTSSVPESIKPTIQVAQAITIEQTNVVENSPDAPAKTKDRESKTPEPAEIHPQSIIVKPDVSAADSDSTFVEPELVVPDLSPVVKITIGRVDVRAVMPPVQSTVTVARQPAIKALSLDEYLKQRNGELR